jgi:hypothetical protein
MWLARWTSDLEGGSSNPGQDIKLRIAEVLLEEEKNRTWRLVQVGVVYKCKGLSY